MITFLWLLYDMIVNNDYIFWILLSCVFVLDRRNEKRK